MSRPSVSHRPLHGCAAVAFCWNEAAGPGPQALLFAAWCGQASFLLGAEYSVAVHCAHACTHTCTTHTHRHAHTVTHNAQLHPFPLHPPIQHAHTHNARKAQVHMHAHTHNAHNTPANRTHRHAHTHMHTHTHKRTHIPTCMRARTYTHTHTRETSYFPCLARAASGLLHSLLKILESCTLMK